MMGGQKMNIYSSILTMKNIYHHGVATTINFKMADIYYSNSNQASTLIELHFTF